MTSVIEKNEVEERFRSLKRWTSSDFAGVDVRHKVSIYVEDWIKEALQPLVEQAEVKTQDLVLPEELKARIQADASFASAKETLDRGTGFVIFRLLPDPLDSGRYGSNEEMARYAFLLIQAIGQPIAQHLNGTKIWDVKDVGGSVKDGARFSTTNLESGFHNDGADAAKGLDYVGLLVYHRAMEGGISQLTCGYTIHDLMRKRHPELYASLAEQSWWMDKRGGLLPGESPAALHQVFRYSPAPEDELTIRYHRTWIEHGHLHVQQPLSELQTAAMDALDALQHTDGTLAEFYLERGDLIFFNNLKLFHNRTEFKDWPEAHKKRHLLRFWLHRYP